MRGGITMKKFLVVIIILIAIGSSYYYYNARQKRIQEENAAAAWEQLQQDEMTISAIEQFLEGYPKTSYAPQAKVILDSLKLEKAWIETQEQNKLQAFLDFEAKYPESKYQPQVEKKVHKLRIKKAWEEAAARNSIQALKNFRTEYPNSPYDNKAAAKIIDLEVSRIFANRHGELPPAQRISSSGRSGTNTINIENGTSYTLTVRYSGLQSKKIVLKPKAEGSLTLRSGQYRIAASVSAANVLPFAGEQDFEGGTYMYYFYIDFR